MDTKTYLLHNLLIRDQRFYRKILLDSYLENGSDLAITPGTIRQYLNFLYQSAGKTKRRPKSFTAWVKGQTKDFLVRD